MRRLSEKTMKRYSAKALAIHLDRIMLRFISGPYRVDLQYNQVLKLSETGECYLFDFSIHDSNRFALIVAIKNAYKAHDAAQEVSA